ncbi:MAG: hypothetical protein ACWA5A_00685 [Marinibacterium sp.]
MRTRFIASILSNALDYQPPLPWARKPDSESDVKREPKSAAS